MFQILQFSFNAVFPILLMLVLGYFLSQAGFLSSQFLKTANSLVFRVLLPVTIFHNIYTVEAITYFNWPLIFFSMVMVLLLLGLGWFYALFFVRPFEAKGVFIQSTFRSNFAIMGLPLAEALGGASGAAMAAVLSAFTIPLFNVLAVIVLTVYSDGNHKHSCKKIVKDILSNPLIIAAAAALLCLLVRSVLPVDSAGVPVFSIQNNLPFLFKAVTWLHQTSGPLALIVMGGLLNFSAIKGKFANIVSGTVFRLILAPLVGLSVAFLCVSLNWVTCGAGEYGALIALFGSPIAVSSAIMVSSIGGDDELARQYVVWTTVFSMVTIFLFTMILRSFGLI